MLVTLLTSTLSNKKVQLWELFRIFSASNWAAICDDLAIFYIPTFCKIKPCTTVSSGPFSWDICPPEWPPQANDSNLPDFSKHTRFSSFIKGKDFPPPLLSFCIAIIWFDSLLPGCWLSPRAYPTIFINCLKALYHVQSLTRKSDAIILLPISYWKQNVRLKLIYSADTTGFKLLAYPFLIRSLIKFYLLIWSDY